MGCSHEAAPYASGVMTTYTVWLGWEDYGEALTDVLHLEERTNQKHFLKGVKMGL